MTIRGPRTLLGLILAGLALVTIPLLIAIGNAAYRLGQLTSDSRTVFDVAATTTPLIQQVDTLLIDMERNARRYLLQPENSVTLDLYLEDQDEMREHLIELASWTSSVDAIEAIGQLAGQVETIDAILRDSPAEDTSARVIEAFRILGDASDQLEDLMQQEINEALAALQADTAGAQELLAWQAAALVPLVIVLVVFFLLLIARPMSKIDRAIRELGDGDYSRAIAISGPADIETLAERLEWLRNRLQESADEKNKFLRHMSHELKTPLANIREGSELLIDGSVGSLEQQQAEVADILRMNSVKLQKLIENLLTFSAWQEKAATLQTSTFSLKPLVTGILNQHRLAVAKRQIKLTINVSDGPIDADEGKLRLIIENLMSNAVKFTPSGGHIDLRVVTQDDALTIDVHDSGPGIAEQDKHRIFEAFYQGQRLQGGPVGGTGIGLSIVLECVHAHKGTVELIDEDEPGAHFRVRLPMTQAGDQHHMVAHA